MRYAIKENCPSGAVYWYSGLFRGYNGGATVRTSPNKWERILFDHQTYDLACIIAARHRRAGQDFVVVRVP